MGRRLRLSLRGRLILVAVLAVIPVLTALAVAWTRLVDTTERDRRRTVEELAALAAREHREAVADARGLFHLLGDLARTPRARAHLCESALADVVSYKEFFTALAVYRADGTEVCRYPPGPAYDLTRSPYFVRAVRTGQPSGADYHVSPDDSVSRASLAYPVADSTGVVRWVVVGGISLADIASIERSIEKELELDYLVLGPDGTLLLCRPVLPDCRGRRASDPLVAAARAGRDTVLTADDPAGVTRTFALSRITTGLPGPAAMAAVGYDPLRIRSALLPGTRVSALGLLAGGLIMLGGLWTVLEFVLFRRLSPVVATARRLGQGDFTARTGLRGEDEVGVLAATFDAMAQRLQEVREAESAAARQAIEARDRRFRLLAETIDEVFWIWDVAEARTVYLSPGFRKIWHRHPDDVLDREDGWLATVHPEDRDIARAAGTREGDHEYRVLRPDGEVRWVRNRTFAVRDGDGAITQWVGAVQDVTERRLLEEALVQSSKLEAVGRLAGGVAHDFNNILMAVRGHVQLVQEALPASSHIREDLDEIDQAAARAESLTRQLLAFGRKQPLRVEVLDLNEVIRDAEGLLRRLVGPDVTLELQLDAAPPSVRMDPTHLEQVLVNLAVNARDAMPDGGRLVVETGAAVLPDADESLAGVAREGSYAVLRVTDTGTGMDADVRAHLFEPFYTTKETGKGTGLGLATVYGVTTQAGGHIRVTSEPGQGACFLLYLPAVPAGERGPRSPAEEAPPDTESPGQDRRLRILVVEDEDSVRRVAVKTLEQFGHEVLGAGGGREALSVLDATAVDLVLSDVMMPDMTGPELQKALREAHIRVPVVFMSGFSGEAGGIPLEGASFLQKPFTRDDLRSAIRAALASGKKDA